MIMEILQFIMQHRNCQNFVPSDHQFPTLSPNNLSTFRVLLSPKKGSADLELASEGITNVTEYCKLLPVALFPKQQQCGMVF